MPLRRLSQNWRQEFASFHIPLILFIPIPNTVANLTASVERPFPVISLFSSLSVPNHGNRIILSSRHANSGRKWRVGELKTTFEAAASAKCSSPSFNRSRAYKTPILARLRSLPVTGPAQKCCFLTASRALSSQGPACWLPYVLPWPSVRMPV